MIALLTTCLFLQFLCTPWITSAKARAKTLLGHFNAQEFTGTTCRNLSAVMIIIIIMKMDTHWNRLVFQFIKDPTWSPGWWKWVEWWWKWRGQWRGYWIRKQRSAIWTHDVKYQVRNVFPNVSLRASTWGF